MSSLLSLNRQLGRFASMGPTITRVILGVLMFWHGIDKFRTGLGNVGNFFASQGVPLAEFSAGLVAVVEVVAGAALVFGIATRLSAVLLSLVLVGALIFVKFEAGLLGASELDLAYLAGLLSLILTGPGTASADGAMNADDSVLDVRATATTTV